MGFRIPEEIRSFVYDIPDAAEIGRRKSLLELYPALYDFAKFLKATDMIKPEGINRIASNANKGGEYRKSITAVLEKQVIPELLENASPDDKEYLLQSEADGEIYRVILANFRLYCERNKVRLPSEFHIDQQGSAVHLQTLCEAVAILYN